MRMTVVTQSAWLAASLLLACVPSKAPPPGAESTGADKLEKPELVAPSIEWPDPSSIDREALAALPETGQKLVPSAPVPVLVPKGLALSSTVVIVEREFYSLSAKLPGGATLAISGTRAQRDRGIAPFAGNVKLRKGMGRLSENEGIRVATFMEGGASYSIDLECATKDDARCASPDAVRDLANGLVFVGGGAPR